MGTFSWQRTRPPAIGRGAQLPKAFAVETVRRRLLAMADDVDAGRIPEYPQSVPHLYHILASYVKDHRYETEKIPRWELHRQMAVKPNTVRTATSTLIALGEIVQVDGGQGKRFVRFALPRIAGPLYAFEGGSSTAQGPPRCAANDRSTADREQPLMIEVAHEISCPRSKLPPAERALKIEVAHEISVPRSKLSEDTTYVLEEEEEASSTDGWRDAEAGAGEFRDWWIAAYPTHNGGARNGWRSVDYASAIDLLIEGRTVEQVQALALVMWSIEDDGVTDSDRRFIAQSDRSVRVLHHKITFLEQLSRRQIRDRELLAARTAAAAAPGSTETIAGHVDRVRARLLEIRDTVPPILGEAIGRVLADLDDDPSEDRLATCLGAHDTALLEAARFADADSLSACEAEADRELASLRTTTPPDAYRRVHACAVDRLVREHYRLPVLTPSRGWSRL
jgi:hypothetical protein